MVIIASLNHDTLKEQLSAMTNLSDSLNGCSDDVTMVPSEMINEIKVQFDDATTVLILSIIAIVLQILCLIAFFVVCGMRGTKPASYQY